ncbi:MAG: hypothetical protein CM15mP128_1760 [Methanobacteriota archaeon]|nr:MAG: hypothetical protein CM15mP128_1760 [Euryarchaeota archaeon]
MSDAAPSHRNRTREHNRPIRCSPSGSFCFLSCSVSGAVYLLALNLPVPPWLTIVVAVPLAYVVWAAGGTARRHRPAASS